MNEEQTDPLARRLARNFGMDEATARRVVADVIDALDRTVDDYIQHRHSELQRLGLRNDAIYERLIKELEGWRFQAPALTKRQIRRRVYG